MLRTTKLKAQLFRSVLLLVSTVCNFWALRYLRLDQTTTISFLTPLMVALLAGPFLGEWIGWRRAIGIVVGFQRHPDRLPAGLHRVPPGLPGLDGLNARLCLLQPGHTLSRSL